MVRDIVFSNNLNISSRSKRISRVSLKKIGTYVGKIKNTIISFQQEVSSATKEIDINQNNLSEKNKKKKDLSKNG